MEIMDAELMKCQLCQHMGLPGDHDEWVDPDGNEFGIECKHCHMKSRCFSSWYIHEEDKPFLSKNLSNEEIEEADEAVRVEKNRLIIENWNRIQSLIAKGLLLEDEAQPSKPRRL